MDQFVALVISASAAKARSKVIVTGADSRSTSWIASGKRGRLDLQPIGLPLVALSRQFGERGAGWLLDWQILNDVPPDLGATVN
ncbi:hypothetical protein WN982_25335 [Paraburkholderia sp. IMGN_8]|uniref:hypothetical protein n=1 Tax=Paraburkholderia sp. IMGN_8 TaxID=3136564 RepID=UPI0031019EEB